MTMRYRAQDSNKDYTFGKAGSNFLVNSPEAVAQAIATRLRLAEGEWFLDITQGTPYNPQILGMGAVSTFDAAIKQVIMGTQGVTNIMNYSSGVDPNTRAVVISCTVSTQYGQTSLTTPVGGF